MINGYCGKVDIRPDIRLRFQRIVERATKRNEEYIRIALMPDQGESDRWQISNQQDQDQQTIL